MMNRRNAFLVGLILLLFGATGFFLGYSGVHEDLRRAQATELVILTEKDFLFPKRFKEELEARLSVHFLVEVAQDPDAFLEKAAQADILWARKDWILKSELHLTDFRQQSKVHDLLVRSLSADFFDPEETSSTLLPVLWTLPLVRIAKDLKVKEAVELLGKSGEIHWPFWGLEDYFPGLGGHTHAPAGGPMQWILFPVSAPHEELADTKGELWFPAGGIRPLVVCLAFVENQKTSTAFKENVIREWLEPRVTARLAAESKMALTLVAAEELLPPFQRASALRNIGLQHLQRP